jgi:chromosome segregation ATPase
MPERCPKKKLGASDCLLCFDNIEGYCWGLCPPKECKRDINEILTTSERLSILEASLENIKYLQDLEYIEPRIKQMEELLMNLESRYKDIQGKIDTLNSLENSINLTLQRFSKRLLILEDSKSKGIKHSKYD